MVIWAVAVAKGEGTLQRYNINWRAFSQYLPCVWTLRFTWSIMQAEILHSNFRGERKSRGQLGKWVRAGKVLYTAYTPVKQIPKLRFPMANVALLLFVSGYVSRTSVLVAAAHAVGWTSLRCCLEVIAVQEGWRVCKWLTIIQAGNVETGVRVLTGQREGFTMAMFEVHCDKM